MAVWPLDVRRVALFVPLGVYLCVYPFGLVLLALDWMPAGIGWVGGVLLAAQGLAWAAWAALNWGARRGWGAAAGVAAGAWLLEAVGVTTGVPFGAYRYTPALGPALGPVPAAIPCAWVVAVGAAWCTALRLLPARSPALLVAGAGAGLATLLDAVLEPVATHVERYWLWDTPGALYYGVPWSNFATWLAAAGLLGLGLARLVPAHPAPQARYGAVPVGLYLLSLGMFGLLDWSRGFLVPAVLATLLLVWLLWRLIPWEQRPA